MSLESILKRDRRVVAVGLALIMALAWGYLLGGAGMGMSALKMAGLSGKGMDMGSAPWTLSYAALMFFMWWIMMAAMMLPSAAPILLLVAALNRKARPGRTPYGATGLFAGGYLIVWACFSLAAVAMQWWLTESGVVSGMMRATSGALAGGILVAAGLWQLTPIKHACLAHCRSPVQFLTRHRRKGTYGGMAMGMEHGAYCLGCCWLLMALLLVTGAMNLYWIAGLAAYVLVEKLLPAGPWIGRLTGAALILWGLALMVSPV